MVAVLRAQSVMLLHLPADSIYQLVLPLSQPRFHHGFFGCAATILACIITVTDM